MSYGAEECWKSLITRYGAPLAPESLDEDTLKLAITEQRALKVVAMPRYVGEDRSRRMYFQRAEAGDSIKGDYMRDRPYFCIVFPRPCEITDKEASILDRFFFDRWEEVCEFTDEILRLGSWRNLIARYGSPLYNDSLDENTLKLAIAERRALKVISRRDGFGEGEVSFEYAQVGDAIEGCIERYKFERHKRYYFCMVFPQPCQITDEEISSLQESSYGWSREDEFLKEIDGILATIECWRSLISLYGPPLEPESLDDDSLKLAIAERRALRLVRQMASAICIPGHVHLERAEVGNAIQGYTMNNSSDSLSYPYFSIVFPRPCEITDEEIKTLKKGSIECWRACEFTNPTCTCYQAFFSMLATKHCFC